MTRAPSRSAFRSDAALLAGLKLAVSAAVLLAGFRALSDDDWARVVIAQSWAEWPRFDASGTSWLPAPFWLNGGAMLIAGRDVLVARVVAVLSGVAAVLLLWVAARWLGASRRGALVGAALGGAFPYAAWLGAAMVPEALTAALMVLGAASATQTEQKRLLWGGVALFFACLSRYEAWSVTAVVVGWVAQRAASGKLIGKARDTAWVACALAAAGPGLWLVHGALNHDDALFFIKRVSDYHRAVGGDGAGAIGEALSRAPLSVLRCEPELAVIALVSLLAAGRGFFIARYRAVGAALAALLVFLMLGDVSRAAPTHHGERAVLAVWCALALIGGDAIDRAVRRGRRRFATVAAALAAVALFTVRPWFARRDDFVDRTDHVEIGAHARTLSKPGQRLAVATPDFGFYAVIAGFGSPSRAAPVHDRDPRNPAPDPFASTEMLRTQLYALGAHFLVVEGAAETRVALPLGERRGKMGGLTLLSLE